ncbi:MAG: hypothetical protein QXV17_11805 [Candidatus Micrarchaeaceae archaeon]
MEKSSDLDEWYRSTKYGQSKSEGVDEDKIAKAERWKKYYRAHIEELLAKKGGFEKARIGQGKKEYHEKN